ncbi:MAG: hypothetical protein KDD46_06195 [Bdellovibrionales bacterium]|nr:hypothetical protein [Bdellovibrionales bacterium]
MKNKKTVLQIILLSCLLLASTWLSGCGGYYIEDESGWITYEEVIVYETLPVYDRLVFEISWPKDWDAYDLATSLTTPLGGVVVDDDWEIDRCYFLGTYTDYNQRISTIECLDPYFGLFDLSIYNPNPWSVHTDITITEEYNTGAQSYQQVHQLHETLFSYDQISTTYWY